MLAPTFVITKLEKGTIQFLANRIEMDEDDFVWSDNTAFIFTNLKYAVEVAHSIPFSVDIRSIGFVGKI